MENDSNAQAIIDRMERLTDVQELGIGARADGTDIAILSVPEGRTLHSVKKYLDEYLPHPERRKGTATHTTLESFIAGTDRFKDESSAVFLDDVNRSAPKLLAVFDYHESTATRLPEGASLAYAPGHARFGEHRAVYEFPLSDEWKAWDAIDGTKMSQADFALFLEDRIADVLAPASAGSKLQEYATSVGITLASPARLLELSKGLAVSVDKKVAQAVNLSSGESQFNFTEQHNGADGAPLKIPNGFAIGAPVFRNGVRYPIAVRLRYRVSQGSVVWTLTLSNTDKIFEDAISEAASIVAEKTALPVFRGRPE